MLYDFKCLSHGRFEVRQPIMAEHRAHCPECGELAQREYSHLQWKWADSVYRPDGSRREDKDYASIMGG